MKNKRMLSSMAAIVLSSLTAVCLAWIGKLAAQETLELFKYYALLIGSIAGVYHTAQTFTDKKKLENGGDNGLNGIHN